MKTLVLLFLAVGFLALTAGASEFDKKTIVTFSGPVEIPGQVLTAGTYVFKLLDSMSDRHIVQIFNKDESKIYATILAIPDYRMKPTGKPVITFEERPSGSPEAIQAWFYPGDNWGDQFVYPKDKATELARRINKPVLSMPSALSVHLTKPAKAKTEAPVVALKQAPLKAIRPTGEEFEIAELIMPVPPEVSTPKPAVAKAAGSAKHLPHTASSLPLVGLAGLLFLAGGIALSGVKRSV